MCSGVIGNGTNGYSIIYISISLIKSHPLYFQAMYYALAVIMGLAQGGGMANLLAVVYDFAGKDKLTIFFSLELFAEGLGSVIGSFICGRCLIRHLILTAYFGYKRLLIVPVANRICFLSL